MICTDVLMRKKESSKDYLACEAYRRIIFAAWPLTPAQLAQKGLC